MMSVGEPVGDFSTQPQARVFRIDAECYILYLGKDGTEYRPFLRIGNTSDLPADLKELVYSIVVTDGVTGSPLDEALNLDLAHTSDFRYIGDPKTVERFKRFLKHLEIPSKGYQQYSGDVLEDSGCFVYFYQNGNIKVLFDRVELFDLKTREVHDQHYPQRVDAIKSEFVRNTLRYSLDALDEAGLFVRNGHLYLYGGGEVASVDLPAEYFRELAERGHDPDHIDVIVSDEPSEGLIRLFKRAARKGKRVRVLSNSPADLQNLVELFTDGGELALTASVEDRGDDGRLDLGELSVRAPKALKPGGAGLQFSFHGTQGRVKARPDKRSSGRGTQLILTLENQGLQLPGGRQLVLLDGVPHRLRAGQPALDELVRDYWPARTNGLGVGLSDAALAQIEALEELRVPLTAQSGAKSEFDKTLKTYRQAAGAEVSEFERERVALAVHNVRAIAQLGFESATPQHRKRYETVLKQLPPPADLEIDADERATFYLPGVVADIYLGADLPVVLYRPPEPATTTGLKRARDLERRISEQRVPGPGEFGQERGRLERLVDELDREQAVTLPEDVRERVAQQEAPDDERTASGRPLTARERLERRVAQEREQRRASGQPGAGSESREARGAQQRAADSTRVSSDEEREQAKTAAGTGSGTAVPDTPPRAQPRRAYTASRFPWRSVGIAAALLLMVLAALAFGGLLRGPLQWVAETVRPVEEAPPEDVPNDVEPDPVPPAREPEDPEVEEEPDEPPEPEPEPDVAIEPEPEPEPDVAIEPEPELEPEPEPPVELDPELIDERRELLGDIGLEPETQELILGPQGIGITVGDVWTLVNLIAEDNGYRRLDHPKGAEGAEFGPDPDWIFPGNRFMLPDGAELVVVPGDTLWGISTEFIRDNLDREVEVLFNALSQYRQGEVTAAETEETLRQLEGETFSENLREVVRRSLAEITGS